MLSIKSTHIFKIVSKITVKCLQHICFRRDLVLLFVFFIYFAVIVLVIVQTVREESEESPEKLLSFESERILQKDSGGILSKKNVSRPL